MGVVADDLAGVEQVERVEGVLDLAEDLEEVAELAAEELGPGQPAAVLARDRAAEVERGLVDLGRQRLELGEVARVGQVEERAGCGAGRGRRGRRASSSRRAA